MRDATTAGSELQPGEAVQTIEFAAGRPSANLQRYLAQRNALEFLYGRARRQLGVTSACRAGCTWCCTHDQPPVTPLEAAALVELTVHRRDLADVLGLVREQVARLRAGSVRPGELPCPFLRDGQCRIYRQRPAGCVHATSPDRAACERDARAGRADAWTPPASESTPFLVRVAELAQEHGLVEHTLNLADAQREGGSLPLVLAMFVIAEQMDPPEHDE